MTAPAARRVPVGRAWSLLSAHGLRAAVAAVLLVTFPLANDDGYYQNMIILSLLFAIMGSGWNVISGFAGYISLGQSVFLGIGAVAEAVFKIHAEVFHGFALQLLHNLVIDRVR